MKEEKYKLLSKAEKRVVIAKDVIRQIRTKKFIPNTGKYISFSYSGDWSYEDDIKKYSKIKDCKVCALGSCLIAATKYENVLKFNDVGAGIIDIKNNATKKVFKRLFTSHQLMLIESAFERVRDASDRYSRDVLNEGSDLTRDERIACNRFFDKYNTDKDRLVALMVNIVRNKGTFIPSDEKYT